MDEKVTSLSAYKAEAVKKKVREYLNEDQERALATLMRELHNSGEAKSIKEAMEMAFHRLGFDRLI